MINNVSTEIWLEDNINGYKFFVPSLHNLVGQYVPVLLDDPERLISSQPSEWDDCCTFIGKGTIEHLSGCKMSIKASIDDDSVISSLFSSPKSFHLCPVITAEKKFEDNDGITYFRAIDIEYLLLSSKPAFTSSSIYSRVISGEDYKSLNIMK